MNFQSDNFHPSELDRLCINTIRFLSVDAVQKANSGHPGLPMGAASMAYVLWMRHMHYNPLDPGWFNRDRFILSAGHGSMLLYSLLYLTGYDLTLDDLKQFRQWGSKTPGHPERGLTPGVEVTTGPLGQGFGNGVGEAIAEAYLAARFNKPNFPLIDHYTYAIVSDGDLMEGVSSESASLAGHLRLGKIIYLYDNNKVTLSAGTDITFEEDVQKRFQAYGWHTVEVEDGNDLLAIDQAILEAKSVTDKPSLISVRTHLGYGSPHKQDTFEAHGSPLGPEEVKLTKQNLGWPTEPDFYIPKEAFEHFRTVQAIGRKAQSDWQAMLERYSLDYPDLGKEFKRMVEGRLPDGWNNDLPVFPADPKGMATRVASGKVMNALAVNLPDLIGGSGDLDPSTYSELKNEGDFESPQEQPQDTQGSAGGGWNYAGRNIHFGVREHAMGAIINGLSAHSGVIPFGATFLIFSDYMRPPIRLASIMDLHVIYVFTHDSIGLGQDGPTHQPIEQLANLRAIPGLYVIRPADANETVVAWQVATEIKKHPVALVLTRQNVPTIDRAEYGPAEGLRRGAYVLADPPGGNPGLILIATGSEVSLALQAYERLKDMKILARVVSMPSWELFDEQPRDYQDTVLPPAVKARLAIEAGSPQGWHKYIGEAGMMMGINRFGASAPGGEIMEHFGLTVANLVQNALMLIGKEKEVS